jgi:CRP/FNR family transcriptional regulator
LDVLGPGEIFGALSALEQEFYPASAEGLSEGSVWCLKRSSFLRLVAEEPRLGVELLRVVSHRLNDARERMRSFAHDPAPRRLAQALLRVSRSGEAQVTRRDLAESAGTTVETAIRVMRGFERDRVIEGSVGRIRLLDESALRAIAGEEDG